MARIKTTQTQPIPDPIYNGEQRVHNSSRVLTLYRVESGGKIQGICEKIALLFEERETNCSSNSDNE